MMNKTVGDRELMAMLRSAATSIDSMVDNAESAKDEIKDMMNALGRTLKGTEFHFRMFSPGNAAFLASMAISQSTYVEITPAPYDLYKVKVRVDRMQWLDGFYEQLGETAEQKLVVEADKEEQ